MTGPGRWWVRVPGSTSNLGPGFDALGMAVDRGVQVTFERDSRPDGVPEVRRSGTLAHLDLDPVDDFLLSPLVRDGLLRGDVTVRVHSELPLGRGLGSSAAARVAGEILSEFVRTGSVDPARVTAVATEGEGHPDNVAPSVYGGLVATGRRPDGSVDVVPLPVSASIGWGWIAPSTVVVTSRAREVLPDAWPRGAVVRSLSNLARLVPALADPVPDGARLGELFADELHVPHRLALIPGGAEAVRAGREAGAWAVTMSGAGSGLLVVAAPRQVDRILAAMEEALERFGEPPVTRFRIAVPDRGATWGAGPPPPTGEA